jgi:hypothetical protein
MAPLLADEDFDHAIVAGLRRREPSLDIVAVRDIGLRGRRDREVLEWAAAHGRVLLTHDASTVPAAAYDRVTAGLPMPGVIVVPQRRSRADAIDNIITILTAITIDEFAWQVVYA